MTIEAEEMHAEFFRTAYDNMRLPLFAIDSVTFEIVYSNKVGRELCGDLTGQKCYKAFNGEESMCRFCSPIEDLFEPSMVPAKTHYMKAANRHVDTFESAMSMPDGKVYRLSQVVDMSDKELISRYQLSMLNSTSSYIGVSDLEGKTIFHNHGAFKMLGYEPDEIESWERTSPHPDWYFEIIMNEGIPTAMETGNWVGRGEVIDRHGVHIPIEQMIYPVRDEFGALIGTGTIIQDITDQLNNEKAVESARRMLRAVIDLAPSAIFWKDKDSRMIGANQLFAKDIGYSNPEELIGKTDYDLYPKEVADLFAAEDKEIFRTGEEIFHQVEPSHNADGSTQWVSTSKVLLKNDEGEAFAILGIYDDITELKLNEARLEEAIELANDANRAKSDFLSRMSHEIRTPMNAIIGMTKIGQSSDDIEKMRYCLNKIDGASYHLLGLINDILDMSKIEADKFELFEEAFDLEKMIEGICEVIGVRSGEKHQVLQVQIDDDMPEEIIADEMRLSQVITNLLSNAVKFTPEEGLIRLQANFDGETEDGKIKISMSVTDNGIGLSEEQSVKLFNSFEQADNETSRKYGGTGLGLAISKRIVEMMGGTIGVESELGKGSTFKFTILATKSTERHKRTYDLSAYKDIRVLVVDDTKAVLDYFTRVLSNFGISCDVVNNGLDAIELVSNAINEGKPYSIIFMDYLMEELDGIETTRRIKKLAGKSVNMIMVSQAEWTEIEGEATNAGIDNFIPKPLFQSPILDTINQLTFMVDENKNSQKTSHQGIFKDVNMLLAEDIEINREIVLTLLEDTEVSIDFAVNGEEAVKMFQENQSKYNVIIMDVQMPVMDGLEATRQIKAIDTPEAQQIPIIAMTANAFAEDVEKCKAAGMVDHVGKPINIDILISKIQEHLR